MSVRGVDFLNVWVSENVQPSPITGDVVIRTLAQKLRDDAGAAGLTIADLEIDGPQVEQFIRETMEHVAEPGTPGD
jgi:hypothetical protein